MQHDLRATDLHREIDSLLGDIRRPGSGRISDAEPTLRRARAIRRALGAEAVR